MKEINQKIKDAIDNISPDYGHIVIIAILVFLILKK